MTQEVPGWIQRQKDGGETRAEKPLLWFSQAGMDPAREVLGLVSLNNFSGLWAMGRAPVGWYVGDLGQGWGSSVWRVSLIKKVVGGQA